ncbi:TraR/DksA family transcriptional regulator [Candidatus Neptunochlamydia vexilliferae]|uniref:TraR/DksA family transcriptional regulator n=1 Tax=Candidatus Neptunichlamydia vexilliferae TaxID=1651774 RepID=UPI001891EB9F|nr:TraR/DksA family transcriptional regulator [Candidatus Neptunochlamydia vexilliferae]
MPLKKSEIETFKKRLLEMKEQLGASLKSVSDDVKTPDDSKGYSQHQADEGTDDFGQTISIEVSSQEQGIIRQIDRALEKIEEGTYGKCDVSGEEIPIKRLEAIPYATMTVASQEKFEKGMI